MPRPTYLGTAHSLALRAWRTKFPAGQLQPHDELVCVIQAGIEEIEAPLRAEIERLEKEVSLAKETVVENFASAQAEIERLREALRWADEQIFEALRFANDAFATGFEDGKAGKILELRRALKIKE